MIELVPRPVVVGVGPETSMATVDVAAAEARSRHLPLRLLATHPAAGSGPHETLTAVLRRVCAVWPGLPVTARNVTGEAGTLLVAASRTAAVVVVGQDRVGACAAQVAAHALCPTMVVPVGVPRTDGPVLLGLSVEPGEEPAIEFAFDAAARRGVPLVVAHVWAGLPGDALGAVDPFAFDLRQAYAAADRMIAESVAGWGEKFPDVEVDRMPLHDPDPARTLLDASAMAGLVVVGARRLDRHSGQSLGRVPRTLLGAAGCPVTVVRLTRPAYP